MFDFVVGLGQGGGRLAKAFKEGLKVPALLMNFAGIDFSQMGLGQYEQLVLEHGGTGRDPQYGEKLARENAAAIADAFDQRKAFADSERIIVCVGGGGGAGTGFLFPVLEYLLSKSKDILLIYTLPEPREGLPTKPNALQALDRLIETYIQTEKIATLLVDNSFCLQTYGQHDGDYWGGVNAGIVTSLKRFHMLTQLDRFHDFIDISAGYKALDANDLKRMLFAKNGYIDLRRMVFRDRVGEADGLQRIIRESSLVFESLDIRTVKQYVVSIGVPMAWKRYPWCSEFIEAVFLAVSKATRHAPMVIRTSYYNSRIDEMQVHLLLSGMARSRGIDRMIKGTEKDQQRLHDRRGVDRLAIKKVLKNTRR